MGTVQMSAGSRATKVQQVHILLEFTHHSVHILSLLKHLAKEVHSECLSHIYNICTCMQTGYYYYFVLYDYSRIQR